MRAKHLKCWVLRHREAAEEAIYCIAFNQIDSSLGTTFATVGVNCATVYRIDEPAVEDTVAGKGSSNTADAGKRARTANGALMTQCTLTTLQAYSDKDEHECFYCCAWGIEQPGAASAGCLLAVGGLMRQIRVIDCCAGGVRATLQGHGGAINELRFHPRESALLFSASADESLRMWHVGTRECLATFAGDVGHRDAVISLDVRLDGATFASGSIDGTVKIWPLTGAKLTERIAAANERAAGETTESGTKGRDEEAAPGGGAPTPAQAPAPGGAEGERATCHHFPLMIQRPAATYERVHYEGTAQMSYWVDCVRYVGDLLLTRGSDGRALLWHPQQTGESERCEPPASQSSSKADGSPGGGAAAQQRWHNVQRPTAAREFRIEGTAGIWYLRFQMDLRRRRLAMGNTRGEVVVWDLDAEPVAPAGSNDVGAGPGVGSEGAGAAASSCGNDGSASPQEAQTPRVPASFILRVPSKQEIRDLQQRSGKKSKHGKNPPAEESLTVRSTAMSPDGRHIVCGCDEGSIVVWATR
jgi:polycomb protein EED